MKCWRTRPTAGQHRIRRPASPPTLVATTGIPSLSRKACANLALAAPISCRPATVLAPPNNLASNRLRPAPRSSAAVAMSPSRWPRSLSRGSSSPTFCGSLLNCGRHPIRRRRERRGCHALRLKPRESYALMKVKSTFPPGNTLAPRLWRTDDATCPSSILPMLPVCADTRRNTPFIRWISVYCKTRSQHVDHLVDIG